MRVPLILGGIVAVGGIVAPFLNWLTASPGTGADGIRVGLLGRLGRRYRMAWVRLALLVVSWPYMVDRLMGVPRHASLTGPCVEVWRDGPRRLYRYAAHHGGPVVLVVHSAITGPQILDLASGHSLIGDLNAAGMEVFLLDWGDPGPEQALDGLGTYLSELRQVESRVLEISGAERLQLLGYCMGGLFVLLRLACWEHPRVASAALMALPFDLAVPGGMRTLMTSRLLKPVTLLDAHGCIPASLVRESFHFLRPRAVRAVVQGLRSRRDAAYRAVYLPLAAWLWDHRRLSGALFYDQVELFRSNALARGTMKIRGVPVDLSKIEVPLLSVVAERDHIVPPASSRPLADVPGISVETVHIVGGHVSMMIGGDEGKPLVNALVGWFHQPHRRTVEPSGKGKIAGTRRAYSR